MTSDHKSDPKIRETMNVHQYFPTDVYTFENKELVDPVIDALNPIERGQFNIPYTVPVSYTHLTLPTKA